MQKYWVEARKIFILAGPVIMAQISQTSMGFVDTRMAGAVSTTDMAAVAIGNSIWLPAILFGYGLILALTPVVSHLNGSNQRERIAYQACQAYWLAAISSVVIIFILYNSNYIIHFMPHIDPLLANKTIHYLHAMLYGVPGYLFFLVVRNQCEGLGNTKPSMVIGLVGLMVKIPLTYIIINGKLGIPAQGGAGCGMVTAFVYWVMFVSIITWFNYTSSMKDITKATNKYLSNFHPDWKAIWSLVTIGFPISLALFFEVTLFALVALLISPLGIVQVAGHHIALNFSSLVFVLPLSLSIATSIRVSFQLGQGSTINARLVATTAHFIGTTIACVTAILTALYREHIAWLYNHNPQVVAIATHLMLLSAVYQISDSIQIIGSGILRGYRDTRSISIITFTAYWLLGLPCGYILALTPLVGHPLGPAGFWIGFIISFTASAMMMLYRIRQLQGLSAAEILQRGILIKK
ncbi:MAG: MATE family efflux transporter [Candidatus Dasytiphilus stammeri]